MSVLVFAQNLLTLSGWLSFYQEVLSTQNLTPLAMPAINIHFFPLTVEPLLMQN